MLLFFIIAYLCLTIGIGYWASRKVKNTDDFMLAGRSLPLALSSAALFAIWFGSETVFGASSEFLKGGLYAVIEDPFGGALCLVLFGLFFARKLYQMKLLTLGDFFEVRYGKRTELVASFFLAPPYVGYIAAQLVAMGLILNTVAGIEIWQGVLVAATVVTFYTFIGGMWAISITDFFQSMVIVLGLVILAVILAQKAGGVSTVFNKMPAGTFRFLPRAEFKDIMLYISAWSVLGLGSLPSQDIFQRVMSSGSVKIAVRSCFIGAAIYLCVAMLPIFISSCVKYLYPDFMHGETQMALPKMVLANTNIAVQVLFFGSLLSAIMSTTSSALLAPSVIFSENLIRPMVNKELSDKKLLLIARLCVLGFSAIATVMACMRTNIYRLVAESSILSLVSLFAPLVMGIYWKKANSTGALLSMVCGILTWIVFEIYETSWPSLLPATAVSFVALIFGSLWLHKKTDTHDNHRT
ncbi:MAG: sodium:solute symporter family protein [Bacteroidetes bacterium]|nr:sodium:solute symporter family protein [Bacteroidota bacterium]